MKLLDRRRALLAILATVCLCASPARSQSPLTFERREGRLQVRLNGRPLGDYVWSDPNVLRPYFARLHAPNGKQLTRNHPPVEGKDATDHATMHPGLWLAFGDLSGADFWRNKGTVRHLEFLQDPQTTSDGGVLVVRNRYETGGKTICEERCSIRIHSQAGATLLEWTSDFSSSEAITFGDQEEMGLGIRVATGLTVKDGGQIRNSDGLINEKQVWGKQADWCNYHGLIAGEDAGVAIFPSPQNFRRSWFHARDYGVLVANPFGQNAFTKGEKSKLVVPAGQTFRLRFGVLLHSGNIDLHAAYQQWLKRPVE